MIVWIEYFEWKFIVQAQENRQFADSFDNYDFFIFEFVADFGLVMWWKKDDYGIDFLIFEFVAEDILNGYGRIIIWSISRKKD